MERKPAEQRSCIFCGTSSQLTREHLLPEWLQTVLPDGELVAHYRVIGPDENDRIEWPARPFRHRARFVCGGCNSGWMSRLEDNAKPLIAPMLSHRPSAIGSAAQRVLSTWAAKTCLVFQATQGSAPLAPRHHFEALRDGGDPPRSISVWLTSHYRARFDRLNSVYVQKPLGLTPPDARFRTDPDAGYLCFLAVGWVGFVVVGHPYATSNNVAYDGHLGEALLPIWPIKPGTLHWPPDYMMDQDLVQTLALPEEGLSLVLPPSAQHDVSDPKA